MFADIDASMERIAYKRNAAQPDDCPNQVGVLRHLCGPTGPCGVSPGLAVLRHLGVPTGLHGISPGLAWMAGCFRSRVQRPHHARAAKSCPVTHVTIKTGPIPGHPAWPFAARSLIRSMAVPIAAPPCGYAAAPPR